MRGALRAAGSALSQAVSAVARCWLIVSSRKRPIAAARLQQPALIRVSARPAGPAIVDRERVATRLARSSRDPLWLCDAGSLVRLLPDAAAGALHRVDFPIDEAQEGGDIMSLAHGKRIGALGIALLAVAGWGGATPDGADARVASAKAELPPFNFEIRTLSNRADLLSDGDALVEVHVPTTVPMTKVTLTLNGVDVGDRFVADEDNRTLRGLLTGMAPGENTLVVDANGIGNGRPWASLTLTNHVRGGPILLGSQTQPWICATPTPV